MHRIVRDMAQGVVCVEVMNKPRVHKVVVWDIYGGALSPTAMPPEYAHNSPTPPVPCRLTTDP